MLMAYSALDTSERSADELTYTTAPSVLTVGDLRLLRLEVAYVHIKLPSAVLMAYRRPLGVW